MEPPKSSPALAHHVQPSAEDWSRSIPFVFLLDPRVELRSRLKSSKVWHQETEKEFFAQEKEIKVPEDLKDEVRAFLKRRKALLEHFLTVESTDLSSSSPWTFSSTELAAEKMKEIDGVTEETKSHLIEYLSCGYPLAKDAGSKLHFRWAESEGGDFQTIHHAFDACQMVLTAALLEMCLASRAHTASVANTGNTRNTGVKVLLRLSFSLLRQAAGLLIYARDLAKAAKLQNVYPDSRVRDCSEACLHLLSQVALSDAKSITVAIAIEKKSSNGLVSALAHDAAQVFENRQSDGDGLRPKWKFYALWKEQVCKSLALAFQALHNLELGEGGIAKLCSSTALRDYNDVGILSRDSYDGCGKPSATADHAAYDESCIKFLSETARRAERENAIVHMKGTATSLPPPVKRGLPRVEEIEPGMPAPKECVIEIPEDASKDGKQSNNSCFRRTMVYLAMPLLALISLMGAVVWLLLLPLKLIPCLCPVACGLQLLWEAIEYMLKAPLHACVWAGS
ncbi:hypothetical protein A3770_04p34750 [Chloropicon primus]|uniref:BRO1 domain-containing protein n=2 Tax=Chloropicon primus TaxID=1764295 RepID=A0A5B8MKH4_9CHLO|nr:hypothetical protein A3770_04p34750 [Chloropicon primus]|eukprot:QDZ20957.1 hypothetical protein A3770_04p34750 [Chloropicon primus]